MKTKFLTTIVLLFFVIEINAQPLVYESTKIDPFDWGPIAVAGLFGGNNIQHGLNLGGNISIPLNSDYNVVPIGIFLDVNYLYQSRRAIGFGLATGYAMYFKKNNTENQEFKYNGSGFRYIPVAGAARYALNNGIVIGGDIGYAFILSNNWNGGFYYRPVLGYNISELLQLNISYSGISNHWHWSAINLGMTFNLNKKV
ncbi:hypothetical protein [Formosa sp. PL04]|uniref:hypothetical protein n=1 Tax=Formosa sp. PL04 TaxID=3081755 RepID=UPI002980AE30|nr:hypothetical protein [Formosa sp. PL04]MDW5288617.1 hypothetical protein [Formosa sp. PL04]